MTPQTIIDIATKRTGARGKQVLDLPSELLIVLRDFVLEHEWDWREQTDSITMSSNVRTYDLTSPGIFASGNAAVDLWDVNSIQIVYSPERLQTLDVVKSATDQGRIIESALVGQPFKHFIQNSFTLYVHPAPDDDNAGFPLRISYTRCIVGTLLDGSNNLVTTLPLCLTSFTTFWSRRSRRRFSATRSAKRVRSISTRRPNTTSKSSKP